MNSQINLEKVYVYPTDTIYGIGCDATNDKLVLKIRDIKKREEKPGIKGRNKKKKDVKIKQKKEKEEKLEVVIKK